MPGARQLTREGTDSPTSPKQGGAPALEQTCYQCHTTATRSALNASPQVPNIETDFLRARRMPITTTDQGAGSEVHDIGGLFSDPGFIDCTSPNNRCGSDFIEPRAVLASRHAECTDCHNPHRVVRNRLFTGGAVPDPAGTHRHDEVAGYTHTNIASDVLRGTWGVEPVYSSASFQSMPSSFTVKRGDPGASVNTAVGAPYVTREYQVCLKCHSNYDPDLARMIGLREARGALVVDVVEREPAAAGLRRWDVVTTVGGAAIEDGDALVRTISALRPGAEVQLGVVRDGRSQVVVARLGEREETTTRRTSRPPRPPRPPGRATPWASSIANLAPAIPAELRVPRNRLGAVIQEILGADPGTDALEEGDLVVEVNRTPTPDAAAYRRVLGALGPGEPAWLYVFRPRQRTGFLTRIEVEKRP